MALAGAAVSLLTAYALGAIVLRRRPAPAEVTLAIGAILESLIVFALLLANAAFWATFLGLCALSLTAAWKLDTLTFAQPKLRVSRYAAAIFAVYGVWYLVNALAPETTPDGITYHLGLPREYVRLGGFPDRIAFYDFIPQGMEMLYTIAYAFGRHAAAKLVEFAFFTAGLPLIFRIGRRLGLSDIAALIPATLYWCAPVIGLTGSSSYNDAAGVFFLLAALHLLLEDRPLPAGLCAGFCYAIKMPGILVVACLIGWFVATRRPRATALATVGAAIVIAPWMIRAAVLTGNPVAPLANRLFPNPYFHIATETELSASLGSLHGVLPSRIPWELAFGDRLAGTYGPLLLLLPIGLLALRRREGRLLWLAAAILALPWLTNTGARFLMQSVVLAAFALALALPRPLALAAVALQTVLCWPQLLNLVQPSYIFRLHEFPIAAALGIEPEAAYCSRRIDDYDVARLLERVTPPDARTLSVVSVANAYLDRDVLVSWQSAETDSLLDTLRLAALYNRAPAFDWKAAWPAADVRALRFRIPVAYDGEWDINELQLASGDAPVFNSPQWILAGTNRWEARLALDGNLATRWRTWEPIGPATTFEIDFGHLQRLTSAVLVTHTPVFRVALQVDGREANGTWRVLARDAQPVPRAPQDLRLDAARAVRRAGFQYLLLTTGSGGATPIGNVIKGHEKEWGMEAAGEAGGYRVLRIK